MWYLLLTRIDTDTRELWSAALPVSKLARSRREEECLVLIGQVEVRQKEVRRWDDYLASLDLHAGAVYAAWLRHNIPPSMDERPGTAAGAVVRSTAARGTVILIVSSAS